MSIEFSSKSASYREFSNFYLAPFTLDGHSWPTVEHYFQAQKFIGDPDLQERIRLAVTPESAKRLGRTQTLSFRDDWEEFKEDIMLRALTAKFSQNPSLAILLKETGSATLKERAFWDSYWGTGRTGLGKNRMGVLLEKVRESL